MAKKTDHSNFNTFIDNGTDLNNRIITIDEEITPELTSQVLKGLMTLDKTSPEGEQPIVIILNSEGGDVNSGMAIYDAIKACRNQVTIMCFGSCMSMATVILQAADHRILSPNVRFMIHYGTMGIGKTHSKIFTKWAEENEKLTTIMEDIYLEKIHKNNPEFSRSKLKKLLDYDTILSAQETVDLGLADLVLGTSK